MVEDQIKWNKKYKVKTVDISHPDMFFVENIGSIQGKTILDLAGGDGKNSLYLASQNYDVTLLDISSEAITRLNQFASDKNLKISSIIMDLDDLQAFQEIDKFDNIIISFFKPSIKLFQLLYSRLNPKGRIFLHTYSIDQHLVHGFPKRFCLDKDEFTHLSPHLTLIDHQKQKSNDSFLENYIFELK
ncbi:MAG: class I SAM-dependent methyltransferase [Candidatus Cloacimonetes bacterium]|nr:class I SAM-dependent methyltransferase [Candidatus Cloacimonadota bacterium]